MNFGLYLDNDVEFTDTPKKQKKSYVKNVFEVLPAEEFDSYGKTLMSTECNYRNILGYKAKDKKSGQECFVKHNKDKEFTIVYMDKHKVLKAFNQSFRDFNGNMYDPSYRYEYIDEIPRGM